MSGKPKNLSQAIDDLDQKDEGFQARIKAEYENLEDTLAKLRPHIEEFSDRMGKEAKKAKGKVEDKVSENPWAAIGLVGLIFFVLGFLLGGKRKD